MKTDFRVNVIGFSKDGVDSEDDILITESEIADNYSVDNNKKKYRAEFYKDGKFYGMIILNFINKWQFDNKIKKGGGKESIFFPFFYDFNFGVHFLEIIQTGQKSTSPTIKGITPK